MGSDWYCPPDLCTYGSSTSWTFRWNNSTAPGPSWPDWMAASANDDRISTAIPAIRWRPRQRSDLDGVFLANPGPNSYRCQPASHPTRIEGAAFLRNSLPADLHTQLHTRKTDESQFYWLRESQAREGWTKATDVLGVATKAWKTSKHRILCEIIKNECWKNKCGYRNQ